MSGAPDDNDPVALRTLARECRQAARGASTGAVIACLKDMAQGYERKADRADAAKASAREPRND